MVTRGARPPLTGCVPSGARTGAGRMRSWTKSVHGLAVLLGGVCLSAGCDRGGRDLELATTSLAVWCGSSTCGGNAKIAGVEFNELDVHPWSDVGQANDQGLSVREI